MLVDGHLRKDTRPDAVVPVLVLDVTEAEADKILLTLDPLAAMANSDSERIKSLLDTVPDPILQQGKTCSGVPLASRPGGLSIRKLRHARRSTRQASCRGSGGPEPANFGALARTGFCAE